MCKSNAPFCRNNVHFTEKYRLDLIQKAALVMGDCVDFGKQLKALAATFGCKTYVCSAAAQHLNSSVLRVSHFF